MTKRNQNALSNAELHTLVFAAANALLAAGRDKAADEMRSAADDPPSYQAQTLCRHGFGQPGVYARLSGREWVYLLIDFPEMAVHNRWWSRLSERDWRHLLELQPQLVCCRTAGQPPAGDPPPVMPAVLTDWMTRISPADWDWLLEQYPQLAGYRPQEA
ncbi:MAG: hypothetical protein WC789_05840 [Lentisphaeria bacterium]|jgi:hypothetical protein